jgi:hypothetical protein
MGAVALGAMALGAVISANSQYQAGKAQEKLYKQNAELAGYEGKFAIAQGEADVSALRRDISQTIGAQRAAAGGSGLLVNQGSALDVQMDTARQGELDVARLRYNALLKSYGYQVEANSDIYQGKLASQSGKSNAVGTLLNSAGSIYGFGYQTGSFGGGGTG